MRSARIIEHNLRTSTIKIEQLQSSVLNHLSRISLITSVLQSGKPSCKQLINSANWKIQITRVLKITACYAIVLLILLLPPTSRRFWKHLTDEVRIKAEQAAETLELSVNDLRGVHFDFFSSDTIVRDHLIRLNPELVVLIDQHIETIKNERGNDNLYLWRIKLGDIRSASFNEVDNHLEESSRANRSRPENTQGNEGGRCHQNTRIRVPLASTSKSLETTTSSC